MYVCINETLRVHQLEILVVKINRIIGKNQKVNAWETVF